MIRPGLHCAYECGTTSGASTSCARIVTMPSRSACMIAARGPRDGAAHVDAFPHSGAFEPKHSGQSFAAFSISSLEAAHDVIGYRARAEGCTSGTTGSHRARSSETSDGGVIASAMRPEGVTGAP